MFTRVLIANRGEIAVRIVRACRDLGIESVVAFSTADARSLAVELADRAVCIGPPPSNASYLKADALLSAALLAGCDAVHPGYGFMAEDPEFARGCVDAGIAFVGPSPEAMSLLGDKVRARASAAEAGVPTVPGRTVGTEVPDPAGLSAAVGLPMLVKAAAGGGGRGLRRVDSLDELGGALRLSAAEAKAAFGDPTLYIERYLPRVRHIEIQILADQHGNVLHLFERDCTTQRRYQKLVEEAPSPAIDAPTRTAMAEAACLLARHAGYVGAGTVEFLLDVDSGEFFFIEMNTRLQVEHTVTEQLLGLDLVVEQFRIAAGHPLSVAQSELEPRGHVIEFRINAEDPAKGFLPGAGPVTSWRAPAGPWVRVDSHLSQGDDVPPFYDSMLAKVVVWGGTRSEALARSRRALGEFDVAGIATTLPFHRWLLDHPDFVDVRTHTTWVDDNWKQEENT